MNGVDICLAQECVMQKPCALFVIVFSLVLFSFDLSAQTAATKKPVIKPDSIPGYKTMMIDGFTLLVHDKVLDPKNSEMFKVKPLEVLDMELKMISAVLAPKPLALLRNILIWVEWDEQLAMSNGRQGNALAVYYGGTQRQLLREGTQPLKANSVVVLRMKSLTKEHQPEFDTKRCVLLHEMAHAVHFQLIGYENPTVKQTYKLAMERNLYDRTSYAATNEHEYFAEMSCAYLNRIDYFPHTREDLKKHDKAGFALMENLWGKATKPTITKSKSVSSPIPSSSTFNLDITTEGIRLGNQIGGANLTQSSLKGKVVAAILHRAGKDDELAQLLKVQTWHRELADFGLVTFVSGTNSSTEPNLLKDWSTSSLTLPLFAKAAFNFKVSEPFIPPHAILFDHEGNAVYRGDATSIEKALRYLVGQALIEKLGKDSYTKLVQPLVDSLGMGTPPSQVLTKALALISNPAKEVAEEAKLLVDTLCEGANATLEDANNLVETDPLQAFLHLERIILNYKNTAIANKARAILPKVDKSKKVIIEKQARIKLETIKKFDSVLNGKPGSINPETTSFKTANSALLTQLGDALRQIEKAYPGTPATMEAKLLGKRWFNTNSD